MMLSSPNWLPACHPQLFSRWSQCFFYTWYLLIKHTKPYHQKWPNEKAQLHNKTSFLFIHLHSCAIGLRDWMELTPKSQEGLSSGVILYLRSWKLWPGQNEASCGPALKRQEKLGPWTFLIKPLPGVFLPNLLGWWHTVSLCLLID